MMRALFTLPAILLYTHLRSLFLRSLLMPVVRKACLIVVIAALLPLAVFAEQDVEWIRPFTGSEYGDVRDIIATQDGGSIAYGSTGSDPSERQLWLVKFMDTTNKWKSI